MERKRTVVDLQQLDLLEQRIVKATEMIRSLRRERDAALASQQKSQEALAQAQGRSAAAEKERREMRDVTEQLEILKEERLEVRGKVSRMLEMMADLEEASVENRKEH